MTSLLANDAKGNDFREGLIWKGRGSLSRNCAARELPAVSVLRDFGPARLFRCNITYRTSKATSAMWSFGPACPFGDYSNLF